jgi:phenylalanyl-tRNA synthetase alpha chain
VVTRATEQPEGEQPEAGQVEAAIAEAEAEALESLERAGSRAELDEVASLVLGRRSPLVGLRATIGRLDPSTRPSVGRRWTEAHSTVEAALERRRALVAEAERRARREAERLDLTEVVDEARSGRLHLVTRLWRELEDLFVGMGYRVAEGPEAEDDWHNFEALNMPPDHPARTMFDTFYLDAGEPGSLLLRTHTSPVQIRVLTSSELPVYVVAPGRCYRRDTADARHLSAFHQIEGLAVDVDLGFADLAGTIETFTEALFGREITARLRPAYFPFTEPSAEFEISCVICQGKGCRTCSDTGWIELGGCGMVNPAVLEACGVDAERWSGFAFGFGIDRLGQMRHGISDLRLLQSADLRVLRQF